MSQEWTNSQSDSQEATARQTGFDDQVVVIPAELYRRPRKAVARNAALDLILKTTPLISTLFVFAVAWPVIIQKSVQEYLQPGSVEGGAIALPIVAFALLSFLAMEIFSVILIRRARGFTRHKKLVETGEPVIGIVSSLQETGKGSQHSELFEYVATIDYVFQGRQYSGEVKMTGSEAPVHRDQAVVLLVDEQNGDNFVEYHKESLYQAI